MKTTAKGYQHTMKTQWNPLGKTIVYLHLSRGGRDSIYFRVNTMKEDVTVVSVKRDPKRGRPYCFGVYKMPYITFIANYGRYAAYWGTGDKNTDGEVIGYFLKITTRNQYIQAFRQVFHEIKIPYETFEKPVSRAVKVA